MISTNGSARNEEFWSSLAEYSPTIEFCLDGLEDTHHLYRQDTSYHKILNNAKAFMSAGGLATWKMIIFDHNKHQIEEAKLESQKLGFKNFKLVDEGRNAGPVFDKQGNRTHTLGTPAPLLNYKNAKHAMAWETTKINYSFPAEKKSCAPYCKIQRYKSVFISAEGLVYPCCFLGFSPATYSYGYFGAINQQINNLISNNSLHEHDLETCMQWFSGVESSWAKSTYEEGRLFQCDQVCSDPNDNR